MSWVEDLILRLSGGGMPTPDSTPEPVYDESAPLGVVPEGEPPISDEEALQTFVQEITRGSTAAPSDTFIGRGNDITTGDGRQFQPTQGSLSKFNMDKQIEALSQAVLGYTGQRRQKALEDSGFSKDAAYILALRDAPGSKRRSATQGDVWGTREQDAQELLDTKKVDVTQEAERARGERADRRIDIEAELANVKKTLLRQDDYEQAAAKRDRLWKFASDPLTKLQLLREEDPRLVQNIAQLKEKGAFAKALNFMLGRIDPTSNYTLDGTMLDQLGVPPERQRELMYLMLHNGGPLTDKQLEAFLQR